MPIDGSIIGAGAAGSGLSATTASVVNNKADTEAAFVRQNELLCWVNNTGFNHVYPFTVSCIESDT